MTPVQQEIIAGAKAGDVVGLSGNSWISAGINLATYGIPFWDLSHVAMMGHADDGRLLLFESTTLDGDMPCEITGKAISGVQTHRLEDVLARYDGKAWLYPLYRPLYDAEDERLTRFLMSVVGLPYDMLGALRSAGVGLSWVESLFRPQDLTMIYCSEMLAAASAEVGLYPMDNVSRWNPNRYCRLMRRRHILCKPQRMK